MRRLHLLLVLLLCACGGVASTGATSTARLAPQVCSAPDVEPTQFDHSSSRIVAGLGSPRHAALDAVTNPGLGIALEAKFAYGPASKDLEDEDVTLFLARDACGPWTAVATGVTDRDGRVSFDVSAEQLADAGTYHARFVVVGDGTHADAIVHAIPRGTEVVVFDIDGTLTTDDAELLEQLLLNESPDMHPGARNVVEARVEEGLFPVYVTGRPYYLSRSTKGWLTQRRFPEAPLFTTGSVDEATGDDVRVFKRDLITDLRDRLGLEVRAAYGNASTDVCAYAEAGVAPDSTFIIGEHGGSACEGYAATRSVSTYPEHLSTL